MPRSYVIVFAVLAGLLSLACADAAIRQMVQDMVDTLCEPLPDGAAPTIADAGVCPSPP